MTAAAPGKRKIAGWLLKAAILIGLIFAGQQIGDYLMGQLSAHLTPSTEPLVHQMIMASVLVYIVLMALPFVPGVEIGLGLMLMYGAPIVPLVYAATLLSMTLAFLIGRFLPQDSIIGLMRAVRLRRMADLFERLHDLSPADRAAYVAETAPRRFVPLAIRFRYVGLALLVNVPGNAVIGGGGGLAMLAGFTRFFSVSAFVLTIALAILPVPLLFYFTGMGAR